MDSRRSQNGNNFRLGRSSSTKFKVQNSKFKAQLKFQMTTVVENVNPLRSGTRLERTSEPCVVVIFGATGDLTRRKLLPALYRLARQRLLPAEFAVLGTARPDMNDEEFRVKMREALNEFSEEEIDEAAWDSFATGLFYLPGEFDDEQLYEKIKTKLLEINSNRNTQNNHLFYLATAPDFFGVVARHLGAAGLARPSDQSWTRIIVEKPFGHDLESAKSLNAELAAVFNENQIFRIDHYLGKGNRAEPFGLSFCEQHL